MLEDKKLELIRCKEHIEEYLYNRGINDALMDNPRYDSILNYLAIKLIENKIKPYGDDSKAFISRILTMGADGSIIINEGNVNEEQTVSSKYYVDSEDDTLKRMRMVVDKSGKPVLSMISTYNEDGIEMILAIEETSGGNQMYSKATRVKNRPDIIKVEKLFQSEDGLVKMEPEYQIRDYIGGLEDINPDVEILDPFDIRHMKIMGIPNLYRSIPKTQAGDMIEDTSEVQETYDKYKMNNSDYHRTTKFEKGIRKLFGIKEKDEIRE